jgi:ATP-dependent exoDNAse (exonuclease V) beta subunit
MTMMQAGKMSDTQRPLPTDQSQRNRALDQARSILVQAPAGSGKTDLLTRRFLRLLAEVDEPGQVVAITFTIAAATEMRHRILSELEKAATSETGANSSDDFSMEALALRALEHSRRRDWKVLDLPAQLRIATIDSFCRDLALQQPLISSLGGGIGIAAQPKELYLRAARQILDKIGHADAALNEAIEALLLWRDNNWREMEDLLVQMLETRDRWMHDFVMDRDPDWDDLRNRLERPFCNAIRESLTALDELMSLVPGAKKEALDLARCACANVESQFLRELAEMAEFPAPPWLSSEDVDCARQAYCNLAELLHVKEGRFRKQVDKSLGFPREAQATKSQILGLIARLNAIPGLEAALDNVRNLAPSRYSDDDWRIVRACFTLLRRAAGELQVVFAEAGAVDFIEVAQIAQRVLRGPDELPTDAAIAVADGIRHLLVDEFQDTSRRQHQLLASLIAAWPDLEGRTLFVVGDPMQSVYSFRDADPELFARVRTLGLEIPEAEPLLLDFVPLKANFRTVPTLVDRLNEFFALGFAEADGSGVEFSTAEPAREPKFDRGPNLVLHLSFSPQATAGKSFNSDRSSPKEDAFKAQTEQMVALVQSHLDRMEEARVHFDAGKSKEKHRIAILGRTRTALVPVATALRDAAIPFRAIELEQLADRPEVLDAISLVRALFNPEDRVAWLGILRAPWCGLSLEDLHRLTSADVPELLTRPVPDLIVERMHLLSENGRQAAARLLDALAGPQTDLIGQTANRKPAERPWSHGPISTPGTWLEQVWLRLGGADCVGSTARSNIDLLWRCLDSLPGGEQELLGAGLDAALELLTALPDAGASSDFGVQLMTIHKSKGLEFEVVIVPELEARTRIGEHRMLSWLERGVANPDESGEITEFLVAPVQSKGADRGKSKTWVDRFRQKRETQEMRRILYVAATRAREELHFFARPAYKVESDGSVSLVDPKASLLATAWPALENEVRLRFEEWKTAHSRLAVDEEIASIAAKGESNLLIMPSPSAQPHMEEPTRMRRLPSGYQRDGLSADAFPGNESVRQSQAIVSAAEEGEASFYVRHQGGLLSRALGTAVHALLEELSRLRLELDWDAARIGVACLAPKIAGNIRSSGVDPKQAEAIAAQALKVALDASHDPDGQWILSPREDAVSEIEWTGVVENSLRTVRVDRVFRAGLSPQSEGQQAWWIIDYKTAHQANPGLDPEVALSKLRPLFAPQIAAYARILRNLHGADTTLRAGLYYPRMLMLDWWEL